MIEKQSPALAGASKPGVDTAAHFTIKNTAECGVRQRAKRLIVALALWGLLPVLVAEWLIKHGGLRHE